MLSKGGYRCEMVLIRSRETLGTRHVESESASVARRSGIRPILFLDTNICLEASKRRGGISEEDWSRVQRTIQSTYRYAISYATLKEILVRLARGQDDFFEQNKCALRRLVGGRRLDNITYFDKPPLFAIERVLGMNVRPRIEIDGGPPILLKEWAIRVIKSILKAPTKAALKTGVKVREFRKTHFTFDLDHFDSAENGPQGEHADLLQGIRTGTIDTGNRMIMSAWLLEQAGITPISAHCQLLSTRLDAAWRYALWLCGQAKNQNYDFHRHRSDWDDANQLFYLCDPSVYILTLDGDFRARAAGSTQSNQILAYRDFLAARSLTA
jgi:hypothetical protein